MQVRYVYHYIYLPKTSASAGSLDPVMRQLGDCLKKCSKADASDLEDAMRAVARVQSLMKSMNCPGIESMLAAKAGEVLTMAQGGDAEGAAELAGSLVPLAEQAAEQIRHTRGKMSVIGSMGSLSGPAAGMARAALDMARDALNGANSLKDLNDLAHVMDGITETFKNLQGLQPGSRDYHILSKDLSLLMENLGGQAIAHADPLGRDAIMWSREEGTRVHEALQQLRPKIKDSVQLKTLDQLDAALMGVVAESKSLTPQAQTALRETLNGILNQAGNGDIAGALEQAHTLGAHLAQANRLKPLLEKRLTRLDAVGEQLEGPAKARLASIQNQLRAALAQAGSPAELERIDMLLQQAIDAGEQLPGNAGAAVVRHPAYKQLLETEVALKKMSPQGDLQPVTPKDTWQGARRGMSELDVILDALKIPTEAPSKP
ncbi:MAG: hypothetical protein VKN33_08840 [Candidatus Sericytochromatia bacterium]|nr:hypothetical protein [Candidatus Sericytochromatia bacterium]